MTSDPNAEELEYLRRIARVAWQLLQAERRYLAARRNPGLWGSYLELLDLRDLKHQLRRMLDRYARRWRKKR